MAYTPVPSGSGSGSEVVVVLVLVVVVLVLVAVILSSSAVFSVAKRIFSSSAVFLVAKLYFSVARLYVQVSSFRQTQCLATLCAFRHSVSHTKLRIKREWWYTFVELRQESSVLPRKEWYVGYTLTLS